MTLISETIGTKIFNNLLTAGIHKIAKSASKYGENKNAIDNINAIRSQVNPTDSFDRITKRYFTFKTLVSERSDVNIEETYIPIQLDKSVDHRKSKSYSSSICSPENNITVIEGKAGQGKTTYLRYMAYKALTESKKFPVFITLRHIDFSKFSGSDTTLDIIQNELAHIGVNISKESLVTLLSRDYFRIFIDGFDEVPVAQQTNALSFINAIFYRYHSGCVVTTRPYTQLLSLSGISILVLKDLTENQVRKLINNNKFINCDEKSYLIEIIDSKKELSNLLITPILVDIFISVYPHLKQEPRHLIDFYQELFFALASKHDKLKAFERTSRTNLSIGDLERVFKGGSLAVLLKDGPTLPLKKLQEEFIHCAKMMNLTPTSQDIHLDIIERTSLITIEGNDCTYIHKSILEFYSASSIIDRTRTEDFKQNIYRYFADTKGDFRQILIYLRDLDRENFYVFYCKPLLNLFGFDIKNPAKEVNFDMLEAFMLPSSLKVTRKEVHPFYQTKDTVLTKLLYLDESVGLDLILPWQQVPPEVLHSKFSNLYSISEPDQETYIEISVLDICEHYPHFKAKILSLINERLSNINSNILESEKVLSNQNDLSNLLFGTVPDNC
ncbi:NACHT domain-containing protein [Vibrio rumoiensis]|uniref:NACHT domain-containing protein n=1 Tax=Vibrio rumoiensis TaxID=76258 RepID=A0ABW7J061_9VIBR